jgi:hypothetical protein
MGLTLTAQTRELIVVPPNPTALALHKPMGSVGAISCWCRWPTHGEWWERAKAAGGWVGGSSCWLLCIVVVFWVVAHSCVVKSRVIKHGVPKPLADFAPIFKHDNMNTCSL